MCDYSQNSVAMFAFLCYSCVIGPVLRYCGSGEGYPSGLSSMQYRAAAHVYVRRVLGDVVRGPAPLFTVCSMRRTKIVGFTLHNRSGRGLDTAF